MSLKLLKKYVVSFLIVILVTSAVLNPLSPMTEVTAKENDELEGVNKAKTIGEMRSALESLLESSTIIEEVMIPEKVLYEVENIADVKGTVKLSVLDGSGELYSNTFNTFLKEDDDEFLYDNREDLAEALGGFISEYEQTSDEGDYNNDGVIGVEGYTIVKDEDLDPYRFVEFEAKIQGDKAVNGEGVLEFKVEPIDLPEDFYTFDGDNGSSTQKAKYTITINKEVPENQNVSFEFKYPNFEGVIELNKGETKKDIANNLATLIGNNLTDYNVIYPSIDGGGNPTIDDTITIEHKEDGNRLDMDFNFNDNTGLEVGDQIRFAGSLNAYAGLSNEGKNEVAKNILFYRSGNGYKDSASEDYYLRDYYKEAVIAQHFFEKSTENGMMNNALERVNEVEKIEDMHDVIQRYDRYLGLLTAFDYNKILGDEIRRKNVAEHVLKNRPGTGFSTASSLKEVFNRGVIIQVVEEIKKAERLKAELEKLVNIDVLNLDLTDYNKLKFSNNIEYQKNVVEAVMSINGYESYDQIRTVFEKAVQKELADLHREVISQVNQETDAKALGEIIIGNFPKVLNIPDNSINIYRSMSSQVQIGIMQAVIQNRPANGFSKVSEITVAVNSAISEIANGYIVEPSRLETGVKSGVVGEIRIKFNYLISFTTVGSNEALALQGNDIQIIEESTGENVVKKPEPDENPRYISGNELEIPYQPLKPGERYTVYIKPGVLSRGSTPINTPISWTFYTEKQPKVYEFLVFEPNGEVFTYPTSIFSPNADKKYRIPALMGVHRIGVGVNQAMIIEFDSPIAFMYENPEIAIIGEPTWLWSDGFIHTIGVNPEIQGKKLILYFDNNEDQYDYLEHGMTYTLNLPQGLITSADGGTLTNEAIEIKFSTVDGFKKTLMENQTQNIDSLFSEYPPRNIAVKVPKVYIQNIETIHRDQGLTPDDLAGPNLTNVDVYTDDAVETVRIVTDQGMRPSLEKVNGRFTTGFAGLTEDTSNLSIYAYDKYGKLLEKRSYKLASANQEDGQQGGQDGEQGYKKNDYIPEFTDNMGKTHSLRDLMEDPTILEEVLNHIPVSELDRLGMFYPAFEQYDQIEID